MQEPADRLLQRVHALPQSTTLRARLAAAQEQVNEQFRQRLHDLPPEIIEMVYDFTFKVHSSTTTIDLAYRPPSIMAVDRKSRKEAQMRYLLDTKLTFDHEEVCKVWLERLPRRQRLLICYIRINLENVVKRVGLEWSPGRTNRVLGDERRRILSESPYLVLLGLEIGAKLPGESEISWSSNPAMDWAGVGQ